MRNVSRERWSQHDLAFYDDMNKAIMLTDQHFENTLFKEAIKTGFYDLQV